MQDQLPVQNAMISLYVQLIAALWLSTMLLMLQDFGLRYSLLALLFILKNYFQKLLITDMAS